MSFDEVGLRRNGSSVIQTMLGRLAEEEVREEEREIPLGRNTVGTVPVRNCVLTDGLITEGVTRQQRHQDCEDVCALFVVLVIGGSHQRKAMDGWRDRTNFAGSRMSERCRAAKIVNSTRDGNVVRLSLAPGLFRSMGGAT